MVLTGASGQLLTGRMGTLRVSAHAGHYRGERRLSTGPALHEHSQVDDVEDLAASLIPP